MRYISYVATAAFVFIAAGVPDSARAIGLVNPASAASIIQQAIAGLEQYKEAQEGAKLQDPELSYAMRKAVVLADLLFDYNGKLNVSMCSTAKPYFVPQMPEEYEVNIGNILDQLDASWQPFFDMVVKPQDSQNVSNLVLRALFGLGSDDAVTDRHAKVAVLASMFAPYNQGPVGDCFAVSDLIRDHDEYYRHSAADYAAILQNGFLTRPVGAQPDNFFFLPVIADGDREKTFTIDSTGAITGTNQSLFATPGMTAACSLMGCDIVPDLTDQVLQMLFQGAADVTMQVTIDQILGACAQAISTQTMEDPASILARGEYGFSSLTNNPVLRGAECAFAAMAEDRPQDSTRGNVNDCIEQALKGVWDAFDMNLPVNDFHKAFSDNFNASFRLIYNADIPLAQVSADGSSSDGGFQLFKRISGMASAIGVQVATPDDFGQLVLDAIAAAAAQLGSTDDVNSIADQLNAYVQGDAFLRDALWAYDQANQQEPDPVGNYQKLSRTPMQSCDGDNPYEVDDVDTGAMFEANVQNHTPVNMQDLISWSLDMAHKVMPGLYPMNSPQHAFNYAPGNPDIAAFVKDGRSSDQWIKQMLVIPGMKIATRQIDTKTRTALSNAVLNSISNALPDQNGYNSLVASLAMKPMSTQQYAQSLVAGVNKLIGDPSQAGQTALIVDSALLQVLPLQDLNMLEKTAIRFAFTNWNDGTKDIYFCAFFNPRTQQVGFASIDEDKTNLQPMDEQAWVNMQQWDVDLTAVAQKSLQKAM